jgi:F-type H+-transporting ATPase subunit beta
MATKTAAQNNTATNVGTIAQVIGPVVDVKFESNMPAIYNALEINKEDNTKLVLEVEQQLSGNTVRTIAMSSTDGLKRGMPVVDTVWSTNLYGSPLS